MDNKTRALKAAFPYTLPIFAGFFVLGTSYGFLLSRFGFPFYYATLMSLFIFAGSMEIMTANLLLLPFDPLAAFFLTLLINARHLFYGIPLLDKYHNTGWKKLYLIYGLCDETFSINSVIDCPSAVDNTWFVFFITLLNQSYWVFSSTLGGIIGSLTDFNLPGLDFVLTALFVVLLLDQWLKSRKHFSVLAGLVAALLSLTIFGPKYFMIPTMILIIAYFYFSYKKAGLKPRVTAKLSLLLR